MEGNHCSPQIYRVLDVSGLCAHQVIFFDAWSQIVVPRALSSNVPMIFIFLTVDISGFSSPRLISNPAFGLFRFNGVDLIWPRFPQIRQR